MSTVRNSNSLPASSSACHITTPKACWLPTLSLLSTLSNLLRIWPHPLKGLRKPKARFCLVFMFAFGCLATQGPVFPNSRSVYSSVLPSAWGAFTKLGVQDFLFKKCFPPANGYKLPDIKMNYFGWELKYLKDIPYGGHLGPQAGCKEQLSWLSWWGDSSPNDCPVISVWSKISRPTYKLPVRRLLHSLLVMTSRILRELAQEKMGVYIPAPPHRHHSLCLFISYLSPHKDFSYKRNWVLTRT